MTPSEYVGRIVVPTIKEALDTPGDRRRNYLACIVTYHIVDYLVVAIKPQVSNRVATYLR
jgi:hypothetical protein